MKYMKKLFIMGMCVMTMVAMTGCGDTMNSATDGTKDEMMDPAIDEMYNEDDTLMNDVENGADDIIKGTEDVLDDMGDAIMDGFDDDVIEDIGEGANYGNTEIKNN